MNCKIVFCLKLFLLLGDSRAERAGMNGVKGGGGAEGTHGWAAMVSVPGFSHMWSKADPLRCCRDGWMVGTRSEVWPEVCTEGEWGFTCFKSRCMPCLGISKGTAGAIPPLTLRCSQSALLHPILPTQGLLFISLPNKSVSLNSSHALPTFGSDGPFSTEGPSHRGDSSPPPTPISALSHAQEHQ